MTTRFNNPRGTRINNSKQGIKTKPGSANNRTSNSLSSRSCDDKPQHGTEANEVCDEVSSNISGQNGKVCDKVPSPSPNENNTPEVKRPILRVNLIKKSTRPVQITTSSIGRRNLEAQQRFASRIATTTEPPPTKQNDSDSTNPAGSSGPDTEISTSNNTESCRAPVSKPSDSSKKYNNREKRESTKTNQSVSTTQDEAKKSQHPVVSMIRDISKTASREDFDKLLNEINGVIDEFRPGRQSSTQKNSKEQPAVLSRDSRKASGKKQASSNERASASGNEISLGQPVIEPKDSDHSDKIDELVDSSLELSDETQVNQETKEQQDSMNEESAIEIQRQYRRYVIELSSDEDTVKGSARKTTSSRLPGRCLRVTSSHAKYISPHRKRSLEDRLSRAQEAREKFLEDRANKFRDIIKKVEEMRAWKEEDTHNLRASVQTKLQKAAEKRKEQIDKIIRKAHDEDSKVSEIQFINNLEAQNRRHDINSRRKDFEARLQDLHDERQRKFEEKQAKEIAAEERRKTLEAERKAKLLEIQQKRKLKNQKVEQQQQVKEKQRIEKNRDRDQKITAIKQAYSACVQTLRKRINQKQEQSERRHEVNLRLIRQKAFELSIKRYNSFISETRGRIPPDQHHSRNANHSSASNHKSRSNNRGHSNQTKESSRRLQLKPFNTKKFCNLCKELIGSESALFSHLRSENHHNSINEHYGDTMLTTNDVVEIHNLRHIVDTDEPLDGDKDGASDDQQSSRGSSLVNYYHSSYLSQANGGITMTESDRESLLAIERKCRKLRHKLIAAGKPYGREWFTTKIRARLAQLLIQQRVARNQTTNTDASSLANTIDLSANNSICQQNKPFYLKINRIIRELLSVATDQRISGGGLMPAEIIHSVDRLLADINKQLSSRKVPQLSPQLLTIDYVTSNATTGKSNGTHYTAKELNADQLAMATKVIEFYAIDTLYIHDIVVCLVSILKRIVPNVSLTSKLPSTVASHYSTLIDPVSLNSYYCHRSPTLPTRVYLKMVGMLQTLCSHNPDLCYVVFHSNNMIYLSDILSYRLGFIIGNESPASSISGSSSAATLSAHTIERNKSKQLFSSPSKSNKRSSIGSGDEGEHDKSFHKGGKLKQGHGKDADDDVEDDCEFTWDRAETYKRTEDIVDDMTAGLCKLLATVTDTILSRPLVLLDNLDKSAFNQRSDDFIRYGANAATGTGWSFDGRSICSRQIKRNGSRLSAH